MSHARQKIVIIGGNFAGLMAASRISTEFDVTVIDRREQFEWTPNIHEMLSGVKTRGGVVLSRNNSVRRYGHTFVQATVNRIDANNNRVLTDDGSAYDYDACLVAAGSQSADYGVQGVDEHALPLRQVADAQRIASRLDQLARRKKPASVVVVGGGISGMESVGEILRRRHSGQHYRIQVVEQAPRLFAGHTAALADDAKQRYAPYPVQVHTGRAVSKVEARRVVLDDGTTLPADLTLWTAGLALPEFLAASPLKSKKDRWLPVRYTLQSRKADNIFVAGDCAQLPEPIPQQAFHAMDMGELAGANLAGFLEGQPLREFDPAKTPVLIAFGDITTWLVAGELVIASPVLATAKEAVYQATMARFDSPWQPLGFAAGVTCRAGRAVEKLLLPQLSPGNLLKGLLSSRVRLGKASA